MNRKKCWNCDKPCDTNEKLKNSCGHRLCSSCYDDIRESLEGIGKMTKPEKRLLITHCDMDKAADLLNRFGESELNKKRNYNHKLKGGYKERKGNVNV